MVRLVRLDKLCELDQVSCDSYGLRLVNLFMLVRLGSSGKVSYVRLVRLF